MKTYSVKPSDIKKSWVVVDAADQTLGRLASNIALVLRGKHKPTFVPHLDCGDNVIVINAARIQLTGTKWRDKFYHHHTGYMGGIKQLSASEVLEKHPERLITMAVNGMLPKSKLGKQTRGNLRVFAGDKHDMEAQKPTPMLARTKKS